ncbi:hypothetical protein [Natranaerofaba carboxydovora]|uniref:hypothetical protein n=1 Tax=Natranaerofaba carboxydovora TaxID=2742683 RepID=UPI001F12B2C3|nr:hypothetical protein [Natranaerofaba carboxydovora]UMZ75218.1 hypothetical protein ACONDI_02837 [Natranaerofaba carboxydovora]
MMKKKASEEKQLKEEKQIKNEKEENEVEKKIVDYALEEFGEEKVEVFKNM